MKRNSVRVREVIAACNSRIRRCSVLASLIPIKIHLSDVTAFAVTGIDVYHVRGVGLKY